MALALFGRCWSARAAAAAKAAPLADLPMRRLKLPQGAIGRDYVLVQITVDGKGPYDFMVCDSHRTGPDRQSLPEPW
jgi:hypothetical protein